MFSLLSPLGLRRQIAFKHGDRCRVLLPSGNYVMTRRNRIRTRATPYAVPQIGKIRSANHQHDTLEKEQTDSDPCPRGDAISKTTEQCVDNALAQNPENARVNNLDLGDCDGTSPVVHEETAPITWLLRPTGLAQAS